MKEETLLHRQVHPSWVQGDTISSQTFKPTPKDNGLLSVYNGDYFSAEEAFSHYTETQELLSAGGVAVSVAECNAIPIEVLEDNKPFEGHASLDYRTFSGAQIKRVAGKLKHYAQSRGWQTKPESE